jgi:hypothetical protein
MIIFKFVFDDYDSSIASIYCMSYIFLFILFTFTSNI